MSATATDPTFAPLEGTDPALPGDPFRRPRYSYGQLLGADDFTAEQRYHLLRARLRTALLHGSGVACGLDITAATTTTPPAAELRCTPGLAIDALGREVFVPEAICLDVTGLANNTAFWSDLAPPPGAAAGSSARRAYAVLSYRACLSAQVPAIAPPCSDADNSLAYSRILDSYRLCLETAPPADPDALVRDWLALTAPQGLRSRLQAMLTGTPPDLTRLWAQPEDAKILLATVDLEPVGATSNIAKIDAVDTSVRALLPDVQTLAQWLTGLRLVGPVTAAPAFALLSATVATGIGADAGAMALTATLSAPVQAGTVTAASVRLFKLAAGAWVAPPVAAPMVAGAVITLKVTEAWTTPTTWQLVLTGGSAQPLLDTANRPLCGSADEAAPLPGRGRDASVLGTFTP